MAQTSGWLTALGPGFITGASDDDPSGVATYAQAGARFGYGLVWTALLTFPLMASVQEIADRTALATGTGLGELAARKLSGIRPVLVGLLLALIAANALNIGADLTAVGSGMQLLQAGPSWLWAPVAGVAVTVLVVFGSFGVVSRIFRALALTLLAYVIVVFLSAPDALTVLRATVVPHLELSGAFFARGVIPGPAGKRATWPDRRRERWIRRGSTSSSASGVWRGSPTKRPTSWAA